MEFIPSGKFKHLLQQMSFNWISPGAQISKLEQHDSILDHLIDDFHSQLTTTPANETIFDNRKRNDNNTSIVFDQGMSSMCVPLVIALLKIKQDRCMDLSPFFL